LSLICGLLETTPPSEDIIGHPKYSTNVVARRWMFGRWGWYYTRFSLASYHLIRDAILDDQILFPSEICISEEAKDLISKLLEKDPEKRIALKSIPEHPFMVNNLNK
jgi:serine/threonine protein kinase